MSAEAPSTRGRVVAAVATVLGMLLATGFVYTGRLDFTRSPTAPSAGGCQALPSTPPPIPSDPVTARGSAGTIAIAQPMQPPQKTTLGDTPAVRVTLKIERAFPGYNQYECEGNVEVYIPGPPDAPVQQELLPAPGRRLLVYLGAIKIGKSALPALAVPAVQVSPAARPIVIEAKSSPSLKEGVTQLPSYLVALASPKAPSVLPDPQIPLRITLANTTSSRLDRQRLEELGIEKWSATIATPGGQFTASQDFDLASMPVLDPGQSHTFTTIVGFKELSDRRIQVGNAVLSGEIPTKSRPIQAPGVQITFAEI